MFSTGSYWTSLPTSTYIPIKIPLTLCVFFTDSVEQRSRACARAGATLTGNCTYKLETMRSPKTWNSIHWCFKVPVISIHLYYRIIPKSSIIKLVLRCFLQGKHAFGCSRCQDTRNIKKLEVNCSHGLLQRPQNVPSHLSSTERLEGFRGLRRTMSLRPSILEPWAPQLWKQKVSRGPFTWPTFPPKQRGFGPSFFLKTNIAGWKIHCSFEDVQIFPIKNMGNYSS